MEKTNLNVAPYYDDFAEDKDFHRVLFRPGFAVQARELTQLQSILQNQVEKHGRHMFKEGTVVIPGEIGFTNEFYAVKIDSTLSGTDISANVQSYVGKRITGTTSGVVAEVIKVTEATTNDPITLFVKYIRTGTDNVTTVFANGERISANGVVGSFGSGIDSAQLNATDATAIGSSANIEEGVYFIRGHFVRVAEQRIVLDKYSDTPSYRVGLSIAESLTTPEEDPDLLDGAQGTSNVNAKGAHRLKFTLTLSKLALTSTEDENFVELLRVDNGVLQVKARNTEYSVLGETLARRTYDESGDYTVRDFQFDIRESADDGLNNGVYPTNATTDDGGLATDDLLSIQVSPGKAYVRGYEIETVSPRYIDLPKPRTFENYNGSVTPVEVGNFVLVDKVHGAPEISPQIAGEIAEPYRLVTLRDTQTATRGTAAGSQIGFARARAFEHSEGNTGSGVGATTSASVTTSKYKLYIFDIRMLTDLTMSAAPSALVTGAKVTGVNSGAYGYVTSASSSTKISLGSVVGTFTPGEKLRSTSSTETDEILENSSNADITISAVVKHAFDAVKQIAMDDPDTGDADFTANAILNSNLTLTGLVTYGGSGTVINGFQTDFTNELRIGDIVAFPSGSAGALEERKVTAVTNANTISISATLSNGITSVGATRKRVTITDQNKNILLRKLQKNAIKTLLTENNSGVSDTSIIIRRSFAGTTNASGLVTFSAGSNETFNAIDNTDYVLMVSKTGAGSAATGDIINLSASDVTVAGSGTNALSITSSVLLGNAAKVRLIATLTRTVVNAKSKTRNRMHQVLVDNDGVAGGAAYGSSAHHKDISLGVADVHRLYGVFDSEDDSANPTLPQWTVTGASGSFTKGELITGSTTGAIARVINPISPITFIILNSITFASGETITGAESSSTATLDTFTDGSRNVTNNFVMDTGQRDNFYDIGRLVRKASAIAPTGRLLIVCDYFDHAAGDFFTVDSYSAIDYKDIPIYTATRVDPEVAEPTGEYDLRDAVDFRPRVANATTTTVTIQNQTTNKVTSMSFNFEARSFSGTGSSTTDIPKDNSNFQYDFDFYVGRIDSLFLTSQGQFKVVSGTPSENPIEPKPLDDAMHLARINMNPYILDIADADYTRINNRRYTMRDIGKLENRINNIEYYTALSLLEKEAQSVEIQDANGLNRFKSGIIVDNFKGHATGDVKHPDYRAAIDMQAGELRPKYYMKGVSLVEENTTDSERTNDQYKKTGEVLTLPYEHKVTASQPYATRVENLNPVLNFAWAGICKLSPSGDEWFEVEKLPDVIINREGNFDTLTAQNRNAIGTVWGAWQSQWGGTVTTRTETFRDTSWARARSTVPFRPIIRRTVLTASDGGPLIRQGISTQVIPQIDMESQGNRVVSRAMIPFIRAKNVSFSVTGMKPLTKVYPFFDKTLVTNYVTPQGGSTGGQLVTSAAGRIEGVFSIPNPNTRGNPQFRTGDRLFRLTSSATNIQTPEPETFAQSVYSATGILTTTEETFIATRNGRVEVRSVNETASSASNPNNIQPRIVGWWDPLAQSFMPQADGGEFITKVDAFFSQKDDDLPVTCQIREMKNGYPTTKVLPFGSVTLPPFFTGTYSGTAGSTTINGTNTKFTEELKVGDVIQWEGGYSGGGTQCTGVSSIISDTQLTLSQALVETASNQKFGIPVNSTTGNQFSDATSPTTFHFDSPVYVKNGVEYCIVLQTDSNKYLAWISRMGEVDVGGSRLVSEQPYLGVLFKSQNNTTWTAYDFEDLKFNLYRAQFDTSKTATITLNNDVLPVKELDPNPIRTINGQSLVKVTHRDHHMYDIDNNVTIAGVSSGIGSTLNGALAQNNTTSLTLASSSGWPTSGTVHVKIGNEVMSGTISGTTIGGSSAGDLTRGVEGSASAHSSGAAVELYQINSIPLTQINKTHSAIANIGIDSYTVVTTTAGGSNGTGGGSNVTATENASMDVIQPFVPTIEFADTSLSAKCRTTSGTSPDGSENSFTKQTLSQALDIPLEDTYYFANPRIVCSQVNETNELQGAKSLNVIYTMTSTKDNLSPVIDLDRKSVVAIANRLDNIDSSSDVFPTTDYVLPTDPDGDNNEVIYCTRKVTLKTPANSIKTYLDAVKFDSAEIQVMYKILRSDDASDFDEIGWEYFNTNGLPDATVNASVDNNDFIEREYTVEGLQEFISFAIKIRMQGTNSSEVPRVKDLRAIALAT